MASVACADSLALSRSAALACAAEVLLSICRRTLPQTSRSQLPLIGAVYWVEYFLPPDAATPLLPVTPPLPLTAPPPPLTAGPVRVRVTVYDAVAVGNSAA